MGKEESLGIMGPSEEEIRELNQPRPGDKTGKSDLLGKFARGVAAVLGITAAGAVGEACSPPSVPSEVRPVEAGKPESPPKVARPPTVVAPSPEAKVSLPPSPTATEVKPTPTPKAEYEADKEGGFVYRTEKGEVLGVPQVPGLKGELQKTEEGKEKVVYKAEKGNGYGLKEGQYAGEFFANVAMETEEELKATGGVVLAPAIVFRLIEEKLAQIPNQKDKWLIPLPVDLGGLNERVVVSFNQLTGIGGISVPVITVTLQEEVPLVDIIPLSHRLRFSKSVVARPGINEMIIMDAKRGISPYGTEIPPGEEMRYVTYKVVISKFTTSVPLVPSQFGKEIDRIQGKVEIFYGATSKVEPLSPEKILSIGETPVFVAANPS